MPEYRIDLGSTCCNYGNWICADGQPAESLRWYDRAIDTLQAVHEKEPRDVEAKVFLRHSHAGRAEAYDCLKKFIEAVKNWDRVIDLSPAAEQAEYRASRAASRPNAGQVAEAVAEVAELTKAGHWTADRWYNFVCFYSVASSKIANKKQEYAEKAMELLQKSVAAGYKDADNMKKDTDLDPLRNREDFKKLISELEAKSAPKP